MSFNFLAQKRIARDIKNYMESDLNDVGIYCHIDESNIQNIKALIIGPSNTPYENGFYLFDINFPNDYPFTPPKVKFLTYEPGIRFNPNLYTNGKVCLSILGTWSGPGWTTCLNLNTVLLSIQSLLNENPIVNEPGFENENGDKAKKYSYIINYYNIKTATLKLLESPPLGFEVFKDIMQKHFIKNIDYYKKFINDNRQFHNTHITSNIYNMDTNININLLEENINSLYSKYTKNININSAKADATGAAAGATAGAATASAGATAAGATAGAATASAGAATDGASSNKKKAVRKSPNEPSKNYDIGYTKISENDGKMYKVIEVSGPKRTMKKWVLSK
jgi:ubiquitin-protein ligase